MTYTIHGEPEGEFVHIQLGAEIVGTVWKDFAWHVRNEWGRQLPVEFSTRQRAIDYAIAHHEQESA